MAVSSIAGAIIGGAMIATLTYVPLYVQGVMRGTATDAGSAITPMVIGWPVASAISGRLIPKIGFRPLIRVGFVVTAVAAFALALMARPGASLWVPRLLTAAFGIGLGFANTALLIAVQTSVGCSVCHRDTPGHAASPPKPPWHTPNMNCRSCHAGTMKHPDNGDNCNSCHR